MNLNCYGKMFAKWVKGSHGVLFTVFSSKEFRPGHPDSGCCIGVLITVWESRQGCLNQKHDDVIKWKHFPRNWPFVRGIHRSPVNSPHKGQWRGALMFTLICARINVWVNTREAGDLRRYCPHYDVIVMMRWKYWFWYQRLRQWIDGWHTLLTRVHDDLALGGPTPYSCIKAEHQEDKQSLDGGHQYGEVIARLL